MTNSAAESIPSTFDDGELYDLMLGEMPYGRDFYVGLARESSGPVLDVACGTGRILLPCLEAGVDIEGVDLYQPMLDTLRRKASAQGLKPKLHQGDMSQLALARQFGLIMIPFNAFIHNMNQEDQLSCLRSCREHLLPGGRLAFDTFFPSLEVLSAPQGTRVFEGEFPHPHTGLPIRLYDTRTFNRVEQIQYSLNEIELVDAAGNVERTVRSQTSSRYIYKQEMALLLQLAGFTTWEIFGGFDRHPLDSEEDAMVVVAVK